MNLPNKLSVFRVLLVPVIAIVYLFFDFGSIAIQVKDGIIEYSLATFVVLILFIIASITDYFDGKIARSKNLVTSFGKFIDPIADKLLVNTMFIMFAYTGAVSVIPVICMIWRDTIVDGLRMSASVNGNVVAAGFLGKLKTVLQMIAIIVILLDNWPFLYVGVSLDQILIWSAMIVSIWSGIDYFIKLKDVVMETM